MNAWGGCEWCEPCGREDTNFFEPVFHIQILLFCAQEYVTKLSIIFNNLHGWGNAIVLWVVVFRQPS